MTEKESGNKSSKLAVGLISFAFIPYWLGKMGEAVATFYVSALASQTLLPSQIRLGNATSFGFGTIVLLGYLWARPAILYRREPTPELKEKVRRRFERIHLHAAVLLSVSALPYLMLTAFFHSSAEGKLLLPALSISLLSQLSILPIIIDWVRTKNGPLMEHLYGEKEIYSLRPGFAVPLAVKVSLLIFACALLPFVLILAAVSFGNVPQAWSGALRELLLMCAVTLIVGLAVVFYGVQKPLDGLIARMRRLASGDYSKTRIYYADEVARLKAGYNEMVGGLKEREELQDTFGKYMSIEIARELIQNKKINLGGEDIHAAVMFCDIRNFTPLSEKMGASELVEFLNQYFHYITPPISEYNGVINKFIGDAVMAVYTPLLGSSDYTADAVRSALGMRRALAEFNASGKAPAEVQFGIGIHCGRLVAGNVGTSERLEYTFIGDTVNVASRLESKTKDFGADIILSETAMEKAKGSVGPAAAFQPLGKVALKGKSEPMELYKVA